jgi:hypothetical protein
MNFTNPTRVVGLQLINLWWLHKIMHKCINSRGTHIKPRYHTTENMWRGQICHPFYTTAYIKKRLWLRTPSPECLIARLKHDIGEVLWWYGQQYNRVLLVLLLPFMGKLLQGSTFHEPDVISKQWCGFARWQCPHTRSWDCQYGNWLQAAWLRDWSLNPNRFKNFLHIM